MPAPSDPALVSFARRALARLTLKEFQPDRQFTTALTPVVLRWEVSIDGAPELPIRFSIGRNGSQSVPPVGETIVTPWRTTTYSLFASCGVLNREMGQAIVTVDSSACRVLVMGQADAQNVFRWVIAGALQEIPFLTSLRPPNVTVDSGGIHLDLYMNAEVDSSWDPNIGLSIKAEYKLRAANGRVRAREIYFSSNVEIDLWPDRDSSPEVNDLRPQLRELVQATLSGFSDEHEGEDRLVSVETVPGEVRFTYCPMPRLHISLTGLELPATLVEGVA